LDCQDASSASYMEDMHGISTSEPRQRTLSGLCNARHAGAGSRWLKTPLSPLSGAYMPRERTARPILPQCCAFPFHAELSNRPARRRKECSRNTKLRHECRKIQKWFIVVIIFWMRWNLRQRLIKKMSCFDLHIRAV